MDAYVIIGNPNTRKSTLIRCLTGAYNRNKRNIMLNSGEEIIVYARTTSLQSIHTTCDDFIKEVQQTSLTKQDAVLFSLWPKAHPANNVMYPDALTYLDMLNMEDFSIKKIVVLHSEYSATFKQYNTLILSDVTCQPINKSASKIRSFFNWL